MSKLETPLTRWYWQQTGGTLIEEFPAVQRGPANRGRNLDAIIIPSGVRRIARPREVSLAGQDVIVVQTKADQLNMCLIGQAFFSAKLVERFRPRSILAVALRQRDDSVLRPLFEAYPNMRVVICPREMVGGLL